MDAQMVSEIASVARDANNFPQTVVNCYDFLDAIASCGITDFTDGKYYGNRDTPYKKAQQNQAEWLLDQVNCGVGSRILDIGCGNGRILKEAESRGATATGITISDKQVRKCKAQGLDARLLDYRNIQESWGGSFDGIIANGSVEHFVQVQDAINCRQDAIYEEMFEICSKILRSKGRFATTIIHFNDGFAVDPKLVIKGTRAFRRGERYFHCARLSQDFGGWYPTGDQLEKCAEGHFYLKSREDGTEDYHITSETWLYMSRKIILTNPKAWWLLFGKLINNPKATIGFLDDLLISQSWMKQFRDWEGNGTPTKLYRDVWERMN